MNAQLPSNAIEPGVLLFETSPDGSLDAIVQCDQRTVYLYLNDRKGSFGTRACWVRNLVPAPMEFLRTDLEQGIPPVLPRFVVNHPRGNSLPSANNLRLVWLEEGNGVALFEKNDLLAVIPPWSGQDGFHGYARDCVGENEVCWPLPTQPALLQRLSRADNFWQTWNSPDQFPTLVENLLQNYRSRFGQESQVFEVDPENWPPVRLFQFSTDRDVVLLSIGMSLRPQPNVELSHERPSALRRIELGLVVQPNEVSDGIAQTIELLAGQTRFPWRNWTWLGDGHVSKLIRPSGDPWNIVFVADKKWYGELTRFRSDPVNLLWLVPLSADESVSEGSDLAAIIERSVSAGRLPVGRTKGG